MRTTRVAAAFLVAAWLGCSNGDGSYETQTGGPGATGTSTGGGGTLGVGDTCAGTAECREGLVCDDKTSKCAPGHSLDAGSPCTIGAECKDGLVCTAGKCTTAGKGGAGDGCATDADCGSGLKCALVGLGAQCVAEGGSDAGKSCTTSADCFQGLVCDMGTCRIPLPGDGPFGPLWKGATCDDPSGPVQAYFHVPRGDASDGDFFRLPYPNDARRATGSIDLSGFPTPGATLLGFDPVQVYVDAIEQGADGFGITEPALFRFSGALEITSFDMQVQLVDLTTGKGMGLNYTYASNAGSYICKNWVSVRPGTGATYAEGDVIAAILRTGITANGGAPITRSTDLDAVLLDTAPADMALSDAWAAYAPLRAWLASSMTDPATVLNAAVFTVGHPRAHVEQIAAAVAAAPAPTAAGWVKCDQGVASPCPDATGTRACDAADPDFDELHALVTLPIYQQGTAPYLAVKDGGGIASPPTVVRTEDVCLSLTVPKGAAPPAGWPTLVFAHGTGGSFRSHVLSSVAKDLAKGVDDGTGNVVQAAVLGIDQVQHGPRRGGSMAAPYDLYFNFANPTAGRGNAEQGAADQIALARFVPTVTFDAASSPTGTAFSLAPTVAFWGHSQGASEGAIALPYAAYAGAVLSGEGASLTDTLLTKTSPVNIAAALPFALQDAANDGSLRGGRNNPAVLLIQAWMDSADPLTFARLIVKTPPMMGAPHHLFQPYGLKDTVSPPLAEKTFAIAAGLGLAAHDPSVTMPDDIAMLTEIPVPASGNLTVNATVVSAMVREYAPDMGKDGHTVAFDLATGRADAERFAVGVLAGKVPIVGN